MLTVFCGQVIEASCTIMFTAGVHCFLNETNSVTKLNDTMRNFSSQHTATPLDHAVWDLLYIHQPVHGVTSEKHSVDCFTALSRPGFGCRPNYLTVVPYLARLVVF